MKEMTEAQKAYRKYLRDPQWRAFRLLVFKQDKYTCQLCFNVFPERKLQAHHKKYISGLKPWEYKIRDCITLCNRCHKNHHQESKLMGLVYKLISIFKKAA